MSNARTVCTTAFSTRSSDVPASRSAKKRSPNAAERGGARRSTGAGAEVVDDVVGVAAERVQRVDVVALDGRQHHRRPVVRRAVALVEPPALGVARLQRDRSSPRRAPRTLSTRAAASLPDTSTIGTPTPGTVDDPTNTSPGTRRSTLRGRNGPVWRNVWASANGVPRSMPMRLPVERVVDLLGDDVDRVAGGGDLAAQARHGPLAVARPVDAAVEVRHRLERVQRRAPGRGERGVVERVQRDEDRRVGHHVAVVDERSNDSSHCRPKWMLWWAAPAGGTPRTPATHSRHDGEYRPRRAARGASTPPSSVR